MNFSVVGHVEWITFLRVPSLPQAGQILQAEEAWDEVGGGGAVAAVQLAKLAGEAHFFTALGDDEWGHRAHQQLQNLGVLVHVAWRPTAQRRGITFLDQHGERTITVIGPRLAAQDDDPLPWHLLDSCAGCYYTGGPARQARRATKLVATTRVRDLLAEVVPDIWVGSAHDPREKVDASQWVPPASLCVLTQGGQGGRYWAADGQEHGWEATPLPGRAVDSYGCGDSFAAALAYAAGSGLEVAEGILLAARCGAACLCGRGPFEGQLRA